MFLARDEHRTIIDVRIDKTKYVVYVARNVRNETPADIISIVIFEYNVIVTDTSLNDYVMRKNLDGGLLHAMHAFIKVIDSGSFTAAAEQMDLTTAQISRLVSELEKRVGATLLQRTTRKRILTEIGANFAERCREIVNLVDEAEAQAAGTAATPQGRLRVQCMANFGGTGTLIAEVHDSCPLR